MFSSVMSQRFGPILLAPPLLKVWHWTQTLASCSPLFGSALASSGSIGSGPAAAPCGAEAVATCSEPAGRKTAFSSGFGRTSWPANIPDNIPMIIAVRIEAIIFFHSNDDIGDAVVRNPY